MKKIMFLAFFVLALAGVSANATTWIGSLSDIFACPQITTTGTTCSNIRYYWPDNTLFKVSLNQPSSGGGTITVTGFPTMTITNTYQRISPNGGQAVYEFKNGAYIGYLKVGYTPMPFRTNYWQIQDSDIYITNQPLPPQPNPPNPQEWARTTGCDYYSVPLPWLQYSGGGWNWVGWSQGCYDFTGTLQRFYFPWGLYPYGWIEP